MKKEHNIDQLKRIEETIQQGIERIELELYLLLKELETFNNLDCYLSIEAINKIRAYIKSVEDNIQIDLNFAEEQLENEADSNSNSVESSNKEE